MIPKVRNLSSNNQPDRHIRQQFMLFTARYGRSYASKSDFDIRYDIFAKNYKAIEDHNNTPDITFTKGVN